MKYKVVCFDCGKEYEVETADCPRFCLSCGASNVDAAPIKTKSRIRAEESMRKLDSLIPKMMEAREIWFAVIVEYEEEMHILRQYKRRGIVSEEEVSHYSVSRYNKISLNDALKEYRAEKK